MPRALQVQRAMTGPGRQPGGVHVHFLPHDSRVLGLLNCEAGALAKASKQPFPSNVKAPPPSHWEVLKPLKTSWAQTLQG